MAKKPKPVKLDEFHYHEAMHSACLLMETFAEHVGEHPAVTQNKKLTLLADDAVTAMYDVYNAIALLKLAKFDREWRLKTPHPK